MVEGGYHAEPRSLDQVNRPILTSISIYKCEGSHRRVPQPPARPFDSAQDERSLPGMDSGSGAGMMRREGVFLGLGGSRRGVR